MVSFRRQRSSSRAKSRRADRQAAMQAKAGMQANRSAWANEDSTIVTHRPTHWNPSLWQRPNLRMWLVWIILIGGLCGLGYRLYQLQILTAADLQKKANLQQTATLTPIIPRRPILDRDGNILAVDQTRYTLYAHPILFSLSREAVATQLAPVLDLKQSDLLQLFGTQETGIIVSRDLTETQTDQIKNFALNGLELISHQQRFYPSGSLFSQLVGYVDLDYQEQTGLEKAFSQQLKRSLPEVTVERMGNGLFLPDAMPDDLVYQDDLSLQLTLDSRLQRAVTDILQAQIKKYAAHRGAVIVLNVRDGSILSLVTLPTYDSNRYYEAEVERFRNWAVSDLYEPGSTFKPLNVAIALETKAIQPQSTVYDEGQIQRGGWPIQNHDFSQVGGAGVLSISQVLQRSSNVGMVHIMEGVNAADYYSWLERLGIGQSMDTDLPLATTGQLRDRTLFLNSVVDRATTAFGQGLSITPLQMAQLLGILANDGQWVRPHVVKGLVNAQGELKWTPPSAEPKSIFSAATSRDVLAMMEDVVTIGTAKAAGIPGYRVGGKTGTAQKAENGIYIPGARITSFVGVLPVDDPQYLAFAVIDEPKGEDAYGSTVAVPIVRQVLSALISLYRISPTDIQPTPPSDRPEEKPVHP